MGIVQGSGIDTSLNEVGLAQAAAFFESYQHLPFDKIYTSALKRTVQTVQSFIDSGIPHEAFDGFNEISWGVKEGKVPNYQEDSYYNQLINEWRSGNTAFPAEGGESPEDVAHRQRIAMKKVLDATDETLVLIAMHGRAMRILLAQLLGLPLSEMDNFEHSNVCLYKLVYDYDTRQFQVTLSNDTSHLMMAHY